MRMFSSLHVLPGEQYDPDDDRYGQSILDNPDPNTNTDPIEWIEGDRIRLLGSQYAFHHGMNPFQVYFYTIRNPSNAYDKHFRFILAEWRLDEDGETWLMHSVLDMRGPYRHMIFILFSLNWRQFDIPNYRFKKSDNFPMNDMIDPIKVRIVALLSNILSLEEADIQAIRERTVVRVSRVAGQY